MNTTNKICAEIVTGLAVFGLILGGCSATLPHQNTSGAKHSSLEDSSESSTSSGADRTEETSSMDAPLEFIDDDSDDNPAAVPPSWAHPHKGGIEEDRKTLRDLGQSDFLVGDDKGEYLTSFTRADSFPVKLDYSQGRIVSVISACQDPDGVVKIIRDGKQVGQGPCGWPTTSRFSFPPIPAGENPNWSFEVSPETPFEISIYIKKEN